jgi:hypothetical protein
VQNAVERTFLWMFAVKVSTYLTPRGLPHFPVLKRAKVYLGKTLRINPLLRWQLDSGANLYFAVINQTIMSATSHSNLAHWNAGGFVEAEWSAPVLSADHLITDVSRLFQGL